MTDQSDAVRASLRLARFGARYGAFQVLVNAAAQRQPAEVADLSEWTPWGPIPLRRKAAPDFNAANDQDTASSSTA